MTLPFCSRLNFKIASGLMLTLLLVGLPFFFFFRQFHEAQLLRGLEESTSSLSRLVVRSLEAAMLKGKPHLAEGDLLKLSMESGVRRIMILTKEGSVYVTTDPALRGRLFKNSSDPSCLACHQHDVSRRKNTVVLTSELGDEVFRNMSPIYNQPQCYSCHDPALRVVGVLVMDLSLDRVRAQLADSTRKMIGLAAIMSIATLAALAFLMDRLILRRIRGITRATQLISEGNLEERVRPEGEDEIGQLAQSFNRMTEKLEDSLEKVHRQERYLENIIDSMEDEVVVLDGSGRVVLANRASSRSAGLPLEGLAGKPCSTICKHHDGNGACCPGMETLRTGLPAQALERQIGPQGEERFIEVYSFPLLDGGGDARQAIEVRRDITQRRYLEAHLSQAERLASLGLLASGISHEINNPLASITACADGLKRKLRRGQVSEEDFREYLDLISREAMRAKSITERLLLLSRKPRSSPVPVDVHRALAETVSLLRFQAEERDIRLREILAEGSAQVQGDDGALRQVFLNLLLNAIQAVGHDGDITVGTTLEAQWVHIVFRDTGCGIPKERISKIFEPFSSGRTDGTGLGLFISQSIVRDLGGDIHVESNPGQGSAFTLRLPRAEA